MTTNPVSAHSPDVLSVLTQAAASIRTTMGKTDRASRPSAPAVVKALLQAEKTAKRQHLTYPLEGLFGSWQLCFTAPRNAHFKENTAIGKGLYMPQMIPAQISFYPPSEPAQGSGKAEIGNQVCLGALCLKFDGPAWYVGKKNLLVFDFTQVRLSLFDRTLYRGTFRSGKSQAQAFQTQEFQPRSIAKLPFFAFFLVTEDFIAARGRGGGIALWVKQK